QLPVRTLSQSGFEPELGLAERFDLAIRERLRNYWCCRNHNFSMFRQNDSSQVFLIRRTTGSNHCFWNEKFNTKLLEVIDQLFTGNIFRLNEAFSGYARIVCLGFPQPFTTLEFLSPLAERRSWGTGEGG